MSFIAITFDFIYFIYAFQNPMNFPAVSKVGIAQNLILKLFTLKLPSSQKYKIVLFFLLDEIYMNILFFFYL